MKRGQATSTLERVLTGVGALTDEPTMRYEEFRAVFEHAQRHAGLRLFGVAPDETVDLRSMARTYTALVEGARAGRGFTVTARVSFLWDALLVARSQTTEEDMLMMLAGGHRKRPPRPAAPWVRVDVAFKAATDWGKPLAMPASDAWAAWTAEVTDAMQHAWLPPSGAHRRASQKNAPPSPWIAGPQATLAPLETGELMLHAVTIAACRFIGFPPTRDTPERAPSSEPGRGLDDMMKRARAGLDVWSASLARLGRAPSAELH